MIEVSSHSRVTSPIRYIGGYPIAPGIYRMGPVYVAVTLDELDRVKGLDDFVEVVRRKLQSAVARVQVLTDIDDFVSGQRSGSVSEVAGPVAEARQNSWQPPAPESDQC